MDKIFVVTHLKPERVLPAGYSWIKVGFNEFECDFSDSTGENIAKKNQFYCELTALYWIWKNYKCRDDDLVGLVHYRRFFGSADFWGGLSNRIMPIEEVRLLMSNHDLIIPGAMFFNEGLYGQYAKEHKSEDLDACLHFLESKRWLTTDLKRQFLDTKVGVLRNMLVTQKVILDEYCAWLFPMLFSVERELSLDARNSYQRRAMGFMSERLFNLWLWSNSSLSLVEQPIIRIDKSYFSNLNVIRKFRRRKFSISRNESNI